MDIDDKIKFVTTALERMARHTHPFIASVVGDDESVRANPHVGSAFRVRAGGRDLIVTAAHVIESARAVFGRVGVTGERGASPWLLPGPPDRVDLEPDIAVFFVGRDYPASGIDFWDIAQVDHDEHKLSTDYLVIHGFPAVQSRFSAIGNALTNRSLPYGVMRREDDLPPDLKAFQFAMDFDPANFRSPDGGPAEWLDPRGLSGSPVWRIGASGSRVDEWSPDACKLVGIVTQWKPDAKALIATKVQALEDLLRK